MVALAAIEGKDVTDWLSSHGVRVGVIVLFALLAYVAVIRLLPRLTLLLVPRAETAQAQERRRRLATVSGALARALAAVVFALAFVMALAEVGPNIAPLLTGVGIVGIAIGLGAQNLVRDALGGFFILTENQYGEGDVVTVAGVTGVVEHVSLRRTVLRDLDGTVHSVPNGSISVVSNLTREWARINLSLTIPQGADVQQAIELVNRAGSALAQDEAFRPMVLRDPQALRLDGIGESGVVIKIVGVTRPARQWELAGELRRRIKAAFDEAGIEIKALTGSPSVAVP